MAAREWMATMELMEPTELLVYTACNRESRVKKDIPDTQATLESQANSVHMDRLVLVAAMVTLVTEVHADLGANPEPQVEMATQVGQEGQVNLVLANQVKNHGCPQHQLRALN